jgi:protocatechuate 3,4-dioxygenase beta subunit
MNGERRFTQRLFIERAALVPVAIVVASCGGDGGDDESDPPEPDAAGTPVGPTPACEDGDEPTLEQTEGPYFTPDSPRRRSLRETGVRGRPLVVRGRVLTTSCRPVPRALLDFWQADGRGVYDNEGYRLRGHQFTDSRGRFRLETVVPGLYAGRTRHIHVKVQPPGGRVLTTQLYFPGEPRNRGDGIFDPALVMRVRTADGRRRARFDFVVET